MRIHRSDFIVKFLRTIIESESSFEKFRIYARRIAFEIVRYQCLGLTFFQIQCRMLNAGYIGVALHMIRTFGFLVRSKSYKDNFRLLCLCLKGARKFGIRIFQDYVLALIRILSSYFSLGLLTVFSIIRKFYGYQKSNQKFASVISLMNVKRIFYTINLLYFIYDEPIHVSELAKEFCVSLGYLKGIFWRTFFRKTILRWIDGEFGVGAFYVVRHLFSHYFSTCFEFGPVSNQYIDNF